MSTKLRQRLNQKSLAAIEPELVEVPPEPEMPKPPPGDLGEWLCAPIVPLIPRKLRPNQITVLNHICNWSLLWLSAACVTWEDRFDRAFGLFGCSLLTMAVNALDVLDGMHARATGQCSKLGEVLDHCFDAAHVPMLAAGTMNVLQPTPWGVVGNIACNILVYGSQLIIHNFTGRFQALNGVAALLVTSAMYAVLGLWALFGGQQSLITPELSLLAHNSMVYGGLLLSVYCTAIFMVQFDSRMWKGAAPLVLLLAILSAIFLGGGLTEVEYMLTCILVSWRILGSWVVHTLSRRHFVGYFPSQFVWAAVLTVRLLFARRPSIRKFYVSAEHWEIADRWVVWLCLGHLALQAVLFMAQSVRRFWHQY